MPRSPRDLSGSVAAWSVSLAAMLVLLNPNPLLRAGLALLVPAVVWLAFAGGSAVGACPHCGARARFQQRTRHEPQTRTASRTESAGGQVTVLIGWEVTFTDAHRCSRCAQHWQVARSVFVDRDRAATGSEAVILADADTRL